MFHSDSLRKAMKKDLLAAYKAAPDIRILTTAIPWSIDAAYMAYLDDNISAWRSAAMVARTSAAMATIICGVIFHASLFSLILEHTPAEIRATGLAVVGATLIGIWLYCKKRSRDLLGWVARNSETSIRDTMFSAHLLFALTEQPFAKTKAYIALLAFWGSLLLIMFEGLKGGSMAAILNLAIVISVPVAVCLLYAVTLRPTLSEEDDLEEMERQDKREQASDLRQSFHLWNLRSILDVSLVGSVLIFWLFGGAYLVAPGVYFGYHPGLWFYAYVMTCGVMAAIFHLLYIARPRLGYWLGWLIALHFPIANFVIISVSSLLVAAASAAGLRFLILTSQRWFGLASPLLLLGVCSICGAFIS